jgi:uncharacterized protein
MNSDLILQDIYIYPVKSLAGIRLIEAEVEEKGFRHDRRWMLVDKAGRFVSQREYPHLALLGVELEVDRLKVFDRKNPDHSIFIPFDLAAGPEILVTIWDDEVSALVVDAKISDWFSAFLGFEVNLVVMPEASKRPVDPRYAVNGESVSFADGMPYLIIGQASLDELNSKLEQPVPMNRFRPNLVFSGGAPFQEDQLRKIRIGTVEFQIVKPCARCVMTTVDQDTAEQGKEPLKTLASFRTVNNKVMFGQNVVALSHGKVRLGDAITPL